jgi:hypothetical protein
MFKKIYLGIGEKPQFREPVVWLYNLTQGVITPNEVASLLTIKLMFLILWPRDQGISANIEPIHLTLSTAYCVFCITGMF